ncbi:MAG: hypothetical protein AVDCRST_MAG12-914 [uncultured Rubrobacteraceae bacterium]|uniref:Uncharacterized protein n=1 Tax=uncultured Rubrobacteraceae bacterium TaxID=349277 RepID=A0A6J4RHA0_9ACTN|nr:MAG: hypothetical protein AVDCRST_MAG12-914 [uncultured Rubrobacteraceae bacterium]
MGARLAGLWRGLFGALVRDNRVLPPVLALLALLLFAWVVAGLYMGGPEDEGVSSGRAELVQSRDPAADGADAPEVEDRDADSYAAYRSKDPFRQLLAPAEAAPAGESAPADTSGSAPDDGTTTPASAPPEDTTGAGGGQGTSLGGGGGSRNDSDGDGLADRKEGRLGQDPRNPDTDGDGIPDGQDDADGDGLPDGQQGGGAGTSVNPGGGGGAGGAGSGGGGSGSDDLFDSGGTLSPR